MGVFDWKHWIVILIVVVLVFGTKKLKGLGSDVGESIKGFRKAMNDEETESTDEHRSAKNRSKTQQCGHLRSKIAAKARPSRRLTIRSLFEADRMINSPA
jgi:sec-independent protein translocase protein TatA